MTNINDLNKCFCFYLSLGLRSFFLIFSVNVFAVDEINVSQSMSPNSVGILYRNEVIKQILEKTKNEFGPYAFKVMGKPSTKARALVELLEGKKVNVYVTISNKEWEDKALVIPIPVRRGILNYRLLAINKDNVVLFNGIKSQKQLKELKGGVLAKWETAKILEAQGYNLHKAASLQGLYYMLSSGRIDYIPRGIGEIYSESSLYVDKANLNNIVVLPNVALYMPLPYYIFISPKEDKLYKRFSVGLKNMVVDKSLKLMFDDFYQEDIHKAGLHERTLIDVGNPFLSKLTPYNQNEFWFINDK